MKLCFDSIDEVREFVKGLKTSRNKNEPEDGAAPGGQVAPQPLQPPAGGAGFPGAPGGFAAPGPGAGPGGAGFPAPGAPTVAPKVAALVQRINARMDEVIQAGQGTVDTMLPWFRGQCGAEAADATLNQIKTVFLPKLSEPALDNIAKLTGA